MSLSLQPFEPSVDFSILISCYFEEQSIEEFHRRLSATLESMGRSYEIIFVNDGCSDRTFELLRSIYDTDPHVTAIVDLYKNSGQPNAKTPAVMLARGGAFVLLDSDLQLDPEELPLLVRKYDEGYDVVSGYREGRQDRLLRTIPSRLANSIMRAASNSSLRDFGCTYKIYDARLVRAFEFDAWKPWRPVPVIAGASRIAEVPVTHHPRKYGQSGWTFRKLFAYNMENIVNLSERPFQMVGTACLLIAAVFAGRLALEFFFRISILSHVTTGLVLNVIAVSTLTILAVLAVIGEFTVRNFLVLQRRPAFIVREIHTRTVH